MRRLISLVADPGRLFGLIVIGVLSVMAAFGPWLSPHDPNDQDIARRLEGPSGDYWLGTDHLGRDIVSRLIEGARIGMTLALPVILIALVVGLSVGLASGYYAGRVDTATLLVIDFLAAFPGLVLALVLIPLFGNSTRTLIIVLALSFVPPYVRVTRASVLGVKERGFVLAERALGASGGRIALRHILPNIIGPIVVLAAIDMPFVIVAEAGLSFLGLGVRPPDASWGSMLFEGFSRVRDTPGPVLWPALAIALTTVGFTLLGESFSARGELEGGAETSYLEHMT